jgi:urease accessory protein
MKKSLLATVLVLCAAPAFAHPGHGAAMSFAAGLAHPLSGLDHIAVMVSVGLWAALKGGRALVWPAAFVGVMLIGGALGMMHAPVPLVESGILASVVALGLLVALAVDLPLWTGAIIVAVFALLHGHAHGSEVAENVGGIEYMAGFALAVDLPLWTGAIIVAVFALLHGHAHGSEVAENVGGIEYMAGFALATATLHAIGIAFALLMQRGHLRPLVRVAGAICVLIGAGLYSGVI